VSVTAFHCKAEPGSLRERNPHLGEMRLRWVAAEEPRWVSQMRSAITAAIVLTATTFHVVFGCCAHEAANCCVLLGPSRSVSHMCLAMHRSCHASFGRFMIVLPGTQQLQLCTGGSHAHQHDQHVFRCWIEHCRFVSGLRRGELQRLKLRRLLFTAQTGSLPYAAGDCSRMRLLPTFAYPHSLPLRDRSLTQVWLL